MEYRRLGKTGLKVSVFSYGAWVSFGNQVKLNEVKSLMSIARDAGVNFFDNAETYARGEAEVLMGRAIKELDWQRSDLVISTKIFWGGDGPNDVGLSRKHIIEGTKGSLKRLDMDYVDLLYAHRPDPDVPMEETVRAFNHCIDQGWALYWGTSEWSAEQIQEAVSVCRELGLQPPQFEQPEYNLFHRERVEREYLPLYDSKHGLGLTTWSPLASGVLSGKYSGGSAPPGSRLALDMYKGLATKKLIERRDQLDAADRLKPIAQELGCTLAQLSLAWCASNPRVSTVITGATKESQVLENMAALTVLPKLTPAVLERIDAVVNGKPAAA